MNKKQERYWLPTLMGVPFAGIGLLILFMHLLPNWLEWRDMKGWQPVDAQVLSAELQVHRGSDSDTYSVQAEYRYHYGGATHVSRRVRVDTVADNRRAYHEQMVRRLDRARESGEPVTAWVNPRRPEQAVLDREMDWLFFVLKLAFVVVFTLVGVGMIVWGLRARKERTGHPGADDKPWLGRRQWASPTLLSGARTTVWMLWVMAVIWNLFSWPLLLLLPELLRDGEYVSLFILLFPLVGLGLLYGAIKSTRTWRRVGPTPLTLDPYPGALGGHIGGTIELALPHESSRRYQVKVSCLYSYVSGSGKNRSRSERVVWQQTGFASAAATAQGTRLRFRFSVPEGLPESELPANNYHLWRAHLVTELDGLKLQRSYEIPVFATGEHSRFIDDDAVDHLHAQEHRESLLDAVVQVRQVAGGVELFHPVGRGAGAKWVGLVICLGVAAGGYGLSLLEDSPTFFVWLLGGLGALGAVYCLYLLGNSLWVRIDSRGLESRRRFLGLPLRHRRFPRSELTGFGARSYMQTGTGGDHREYFQVLAVTQADRKVVVAEGIEGEITALELCENLAALTGLQALGRLARAAPKTRR